MYNDESTRLPTFIPIEVEQSCRRSRPKSATKSRSHENVDEKRTTLDISLCQDIDDYINCLVDRVFEQLSERKSAIPESSDGEEEPPFGSPIQTNSNEKTTEEFFTPRSELEMDKTDTVHVTEQDNFEMDDEAGGGDGESLEFTLKDIPIQEDPESPVKTVMTAQLLAEIDETLDSILNLDESSNLSENFENVGINEDGEGDCSILIEYADNPLEQFIPDYAEYFKVQEPSPQPKVVKEEEMTKENQQKLQRREDDGYPMTAEIENTFNTLLHMSEKDGHGFSYISNVIEKTELSLDSYDDIYLRAGLSDLEDVPGTDLHRSLKTPDATKAGEMVVGDSHAGAISSDDEDIRSFVILNDAEIKESLLHCENITKRPDCVVMVEDVKPVIIEMENNTEGTRSIEDTPFRSNSPVRPRNRAAAFLHRAASVLNNWKSRTWTPRNSDVYTTQTANIEMYTTPSEGESLHLLRRKRFFEDNVKVCGETVIVEVPCSKDQPSRSRLPNRRFFSGRSSWSGTQSLPRNTDRVRSFFKINR